ncbi:MAG: type I-B CRISPR-associated protein Cas7/Cst2/DevR [Caldibacillus debilis]|jgi:CRISPR-associated protein Cst2|uniref:Type I-B CRISPR-associated protein Cas7/Cst2/DevR n=1 Tax=Caldibacillus debilis TaxID=301148 RepID=A0A3E0K2V0_9BACI|nr:type I-B CRISPR-associated protein Cas7/Cst2/DevR [Caldibacillus debilis]REJ22522.1 MAG: type I-B CRISPR-associated protein Cas7/Cst2/DevR [Caldibacillus debilis]REJ27601.1 MAG: type I-B CRISPR-associated protein Cas7/Cst2/DevR [Caldibacillus debilis]
MNKNQGLTFSVIFRANSLNYGEGTANISELKKFHRGNGEVYTFASRQSLRYDIVRLGNQFFRWNLDVVDKAQGVVQFKPECTIKDSVEMDLFGYMKTKANEGATKRSAVVRLSHAISLEPYRSDLEFLNNMGLASRIDEDANLATLEQHMSYYTYTVTVDLSRIGVDQGIELPNEEKASRVKQFLEIVKLLNREIRGRQENLAPLFVIGGVYRVPNPFFLGRIALENHDTEKLNLQLIRDTVNTTVFGEPIKGQTCIGYVKGTFKNEQELHQLDVAQVGTVDEFFGTLANEVDAYYGV